MRKYGVIVLWVFVICVVLGAATPVMAQGVQSSEQVEPHQTQSQDQTQAEPETHNQPQPPLELEIPKTITRSDKDKFVTLVFENDSIGGGTDRNYTNGVRATYFDLNANFPNIAHQMADYVPTFDINETSSVFYSLGQNLYTPSSIDNRAQNLNDRPWAGFLYGSMGMTTLTDNHIDDLEATIGIVGPWAMGEQVQKFVHKHVTDSPMPKGWNNQLKNEPGLMLSWQRRWPQGLQQDVMGLTMSATPYLGATVGNIYTYANTGVTLRVSGRGDKWSDTPLRVRPAMAGTGFFELPEDRMNWYLFGGVEGRAIARNIFLDGNTYRASHSVNKKPLVMDLNAGAAVTFGPTRVSYTLTYRTKEFDAQDQGDLFGALSLSYRF